MKQILIIIYASLLPLISYAQSGILGEISKEKPFISGERLNFTVDYASGLLTAAVADVNINVTHDVYNGTQCYKIDAVGKTRPFFNIFFEMEDKYSSWLDVENLRPLRANSDLREGGFLYKTDFVYSWPSQIVNTTGVNIKRNWRYYHTLQLTKNSYDALSLFYNMRHVDASKLIPNQTFKMNLVLEDTVRNITATFLGREEKQIRELGRFRTLKFSCKFATSSDETFKDGAEFFIWISDDKNKIPIYLESPIRVGKVVVYLSSWSGLAHSFSSIIPKI